MRHLLCAGVATLMLGANIAVAQTTEAPNGDPIATPFGVWSWGALCRPHEYFTLHDGERDNPGCGISMQNDDTGLYAGTAAFGRWQWAGDDWVPTSSSDKYQALAFYNPSSGPFEVWRSPDGATNWLPIPSSYTNAPEWVRDPDLFVDRAGSPLMVNGLCWMAHTNTTWGVSTNTFALASSGDCVNFTFVQNIPCINASNFDCWAPKFYPDDGGHMHVIVSLGPSADDAFQAYELHPLDENDPSGPWSSRFRITGTGLPSDMIDTRLVVDGSGRRHLFFKHDNTCGPGCGYIEEAVSKYDRTGFQVIHTGNWAGLGAGESPTILPVGSNWNLYFLGIGNACGYDGTVLSVSPDLEHWSPPTCLGTGGLDDLTAFSTSPARDQE